MNRTAVQVDIFDYGNFRQFLEAWFEAAQRVNPNVSHRWFAHRLGTTDPSVLRHVVSGRRPLTPERLEAFIGVLQLKGDAAEYFRALVAFAQGVGPAKDAAFATLAELRSRRSARGVSEEGFEFFGSAINAAVLEMVSFPNFREDPEWIGARLDPPVSAEQAAQALEACERLGFLTRRDGKLVRASPTVQTTERVQQLASWPYHRDGLDRAAAGLQRLYDDPAFDLESAFVGCTFAIPESRLAEIRHVLFEVQHRICGLAEEWSGESDRVVHLTMAMVPVARAEPDPEE